MNDKPEDWQAIALALVDELDKLVYALKLRSSYMASAVEWNNYPLFKDLLNELGEWANDGPK